MTLNPGKPASSQSRLIAIVSLCISSGWYEYHTFVDGLVFGDVSHMQQVILVDYTAICVANTTFGAILLCFRPAWLFFDESSCYSRYRRHEASIFKVICELTVHTFRFFILPSVWNECRTSKLKKLTTSRKHYHPYICSKSIRAIVDCDLRLLIRFTRLPADVNTLILAPLGKPHLRLMCISCP